MNRKSFEKLSGEDNPHFSADGYKIYHELRKRYPNHTIEDLDSILNILCGSICYLIRDNVDKDNWAMLMQLVFKILCENLNENT